MENTEKQQKNSKIPTEVGVDRQWLEAILNRDVKKPTAWTETDVREMVASKAQSRIQGIVQSIYWDLLKIQQVMKFAEGGEIIDQPDEDYFDGWYETNDLQDYNQKYKLMQMLNTIARALHVTEPDGYAKEDFDDILKGFVNRILEESEYLEVAANVINEKYPGLASPFKSAPSVEELNEREAQEYAIELGKVEKSIESNIDQHASVLQKISRAKRTDFEKIALDLDRIVIFGPRNWELILYNLMSPHAPRLLINNLDYRANIHGLLAGDISTAKSKILKISKLIAPKMLVVDSTTVATLEGHAPTRAGGEIDEGVLDYAKNGVIIVEEYTNAMAKIPLMRRVMDGEHIEIWKKGSSKGIDPNSTMLAACNPEADFFREEVEGNFRQQIAFKEGILSRYWIVSVMQTTDPRKGKTWEEIYGIDGAERKRIQIRERMKGEKNPMFGRKRPEQTGDLNPSKRLEVRQKISAKLRGRRFTPEWKRKLSEAMTGRQLSEEHKKAISEGLKGKGLGKENPATRPEVREKMRGPRPQIMGEKNPNWCGGLSFDPYDERFDKAFKIRIMEREEYTCQFPECYARTDLMVHHVDYNKKNTVDENCITLCRTHNSTVNFDREKWTDYFRRQLISLSC